MVYLSLHYVPRAVAIFEFVGDPYSVAEDITGGEVMVTIQLAFSSAILSFDIDITVETIASGTATGIYIHIYILIHTCRHTHTHP